MSIKPDSLLRGALLIVPVTLLAVVFGQTTLASDAPAEAADKAMQETETYKDPNRTRFIEVPTPEVPSRLDVLVSYPCAQCHNYRETNLQERELAPAHYSENDPRLNNELNHGRGRYWCHTCHNPDDPSQLQTLDGDKLSLNKAWKVCGQCHQSHEEDWHYGAHGKRTRSWQENESPVRYNCTHCHNPHNPAFMRRKPSPAPGIRAGLEPMPDHHGDHQYWWRDSVDFKKLEVQRD